MNFPLDLKKEKQNKRIKTEKKQTKSKIAQV